MREENHETWEDIEERNMNLPHIVQDILRDAESNKQVFEELSRIPGMLNWYREEASDPTKTPQERLNAQRAIIRLLAQQEDLRGLFK